MIKRHTIAIASLAEMSSNECWLDVSWFSFCFCFLNIQYFFVASRRPISVVRKGNNSWCFHGKIDVNPVDLVSTLSVYLAVIKLIDLVSVHFETEQQKKEMGRPFIPPTADQ